MYIKTSAAAAAATTVMKATASIPRPKFRRRHSRFY